jgi:hypothetical protein
MGGDLESEGIAPATQVANPVLIDQTSAVAAGKGFEGEQSEIAIGGQKQLRATT